MNDYSEEIRREIVESKPAYFPFNTYGPRIRLVQGIYLARCTPSLERLFLRALGLQASNRIDNAANIDPHTEYAESLRLSGERYFFSRNPRLRQDAKAVYGTRCQACNFDFVAKYGPLGAGYIECHHLNPLSERSESEWTDEVKTSILDVRVVCANCHRMMHRRKPPYTVEELKEAMQKAGGA